MSNEMITVSENIFKLLTEHIHNKCSSKNCCVEKLLEQVDFENE
jgi:hypothetical protein